MSDSPLFIGAALVYLSEQARYHAGVTEDPRTEVALLDIDTRLKAIITALRSGTFQLPNRVDSPPTDRLDDRPNGLYRVVWKDGGESLATLGTQSNGERWLAPTNWVAPTLKCFDHLVESMEPIETPDKATPDISDDDDAVIAAFAFLYEQYGIAPDEVLAPDALIMKAKVLEAVRGTIPGWKLVPEVATDAMLGAMQGITDFVLPAETHDNSLKGWMDEMRSAWAEGLKAAPLPPHMEPLGPLWRRVHDVHREAMSRGWSPARYRDEMLIAIRGAK